MGKLKWSSTKVAERYISSREKAIIDASAATLEEKQCASCRCGAIDRVELAAATTKLGEVQSWQG